MLVGNTGSMLEGGYGSATLGLGKVMSGWLVVMDTRLLLDPVMRKLEWNQNIIFSNESLSYSV